MLKITYIRTYDSLFIIIEIRYSIGEQFTHPTDKRYWRKTKNKYKIYPDSPNFY